MASLLHQKPHNHNLFVVHCRPNAGTQKCSLKVPFSALALETTKLSFLTFGLGYLRLYKYSKHLHTNVLPISDFSNNHTYQLQALSCGHDSLREDLLKNHFKAFVDSCLPMLYYIQADTHTFISTVYGSWGKNTWKKLNWVSQINTAARISIKNRHFYYQFCNPFALAVKNELQLTIILLWSLASLPFFKFKTHEHFERQNVLHLKSNVLKTSSNRVNVYEGENYGFRSQNRNSCEREKAMLFSSQRFCFSTSLCIPLMSNHPYSRWKKPRRVCLLKMQYILLAVLRSLPSKCVPILSLEGRWIIIMPGNTLLSTSLVRHCY